MRIREGSQAKTGMAEEKETKGIDYQTWEFTGREYLEIAGISLGIAAAVNLSVTGRGGHALLWFRLESYIFTRIGKTGFRDGKRSCTTASGI